jgi:hypothetical protein
MLFVNFRNASARETRPIRELSARSEMGNRRAARRVEIYARAKQERRRVLGMHRSRVRTEFRMLEGIAGRTNPTCFCGGHMKRSYVKPQFTRYESAAVPRGDSVPRPAGGVDLPVFGNGRMTSSCAPGRLTMLPNRAFRLLDLTEQFAGAHRWQTKKVVERFAWSCLAVCAVSTPSGK